MRTCVVVHLQVERQHLAVLVSSNLVLSKERVAVARQPHVMLPVQRQPHRPLGMVRGDRCCAVQKGAACLLAAKAAAEALCFDGDLVLRDAEHTRHELVVLVDILHASGAELAEKFVST